MPLTRQKAEAENGQFRFPRRIPLGFFTYEMPLTRQKAEAENGKFRFPGRIPLGFFAYEMPLTRQKAEVEMKNEMRMEFDAVSENEGFARVAVAAFVTPLDPTLEEVADIKTAVSEAVTNAVIHAYPDWPEEKPRKVELRCTVDGDVLHIEIEDHGIGIGNVEKAMEPLFSTCPDKDRSGMGFAFMEAFMDDLDVESTVGQGTVVRMEKKLGAYVWAEDEE